MSTLAGPRPAAESERRGVRKPRPGLKSTPGRLRLLRAVLVGLGVSLALMSAATVAFAIKGTHTVSRSTEPLLVNAETIYSSLADADTTAAQAFLSGGLEPATQTQRYTADISRIGAQLAQAASRVGQSGPAADAVDTLTTQLPVYAGLVQSARANNRQGLPVGASYLGQASRLARGSLLPAADQLFTVEQQQLRAGYAAARAGTWLLWTTVIGVALLVTLLITQAFLTRRTRRLFNVNLVVATVIVAVLGAVMAGILLTQHRRLNTAEGHGSTPVVAEARARIAALVQRGDESLTLVSRGTSASYEKDFAAAQASLLGDQTHPGLLPTASAARALELAYLAKHAQVRKLDDGGNYNAAVTLATSTKPGGAAAAFALLDNNLTATISADQSRFTSSAGHAETGLALLDVLAPLLAVLVCVLCDPRPAGPAGGIPMRPSRTRHIATTAGALLALALTLGGCTSHRGRAAAVGARGNAVGRQHGVRGRHVVRLTRPPA